MDNTTLNSGSGGDTIRTLEDGSSIKWPAGVTCFATTVGTPDVLSIVTPTAGLPVRLADGSGYISALPVTDNSSTLSVDDGSGSLTVDAPVGTPVFVRLSDGSSAVATLPVSLASVPSHAVTNVGTFAVQVDGNALTSLQLLDDAVSTTGSAVPTKGFQVTGTDGTNARALKTDSSGELQVDVLSVAGSVAVTNAGLTELASAIMDEGAIRGLTDPAVVIAGYNNGVQVIATGANNSVLVSGATAHDASVTSTRPVTISARGSASAPTAVSADDDVVYLWSDLSGRLQIGDGAGSLTVDAPVSTPVFVRLSDGSSAISTLPVSLASVPSHAVTNAGTFAVQVDGNALTALQLIDDIVLTEDAAHSSGDKGVMPLAVRKDSATALAGTDGDYIPLQTDANGYLRVNVAAGGGSGGTSSTDDAAFTAASGSGTPMMGFVTSDTVDSGDVGVVGMLANRQLKVTLYDSGGVELAVGGGTQYTEDAAAAANPVGNALIVVRDDARGGSLTTTDGDNVALRGNNAGELYVKHTDAIPVTDNSGSLTVDNAGTFAVQVSSALPAGTNAIGKLAANSGVDVGDVDVTSVIPGTGATNLGKAEDAAHTTGDVGVMALTVRQDTAAALSGTDADYQPLITDASGRLHVNVGNTVTVGSHAVTNAGTFAVQESGAALTALQLIDDAVFAEDVAAQAADKGVSVLAVRRDTASTMVGADNDYTNLIVDGSGRLHVNVGNSVAVTNAGTFATQVDGAALTALQLIDNLVLAEDAAHQTADPGVQVLTVRRDSAATSAGTDGDYATLNTDATGRLWCNVSNTVTVTGTGGTFPVTDSGGSLTVDNGGTFAVQAASAGDVAHDASNSGNPILTGARATTALSGITLVADADRTYLQAGVDGVLIVRPHCNLEDVVQERTTNTDGASTAFASGLAAPGAGKRLWIKNVTLCNSSASFCTVDLRDGSGGSVLWTLPVPATGGVTHVFEPPLKLTANTALAFDASAATSTLTISANGFVSKV